VIRVVEPKFVTGTRVDPTRQPAFAAWIVPQQTAHRSKKAIPAFQSPTAGIPAARSDNFQTVTLTNAIAKPSLKLPNHAAKEIGKR
jgi:hypothetical protein